MGELYSTELEPYTGELSVLIQEAIDEVKRFFQVDEVKVLKYDDDSIAIPVTFAVSIPPMGTVNDIDIRSGEPMLVKIALTNYPYHLPIVMSDRRGFPKHLLPHLYVSKKDKPAGLCLVRNSPNEWFANKTIADLLMVAEQWLYKAAIGKLTEDGDEFDPIRLESYSGYHIYKYSVLNKLVCRKSRFVNEQPFSVLLSYVYDYEFKNALMYRTWSSISYVHKEALLKAIAESKDELKNISPMFSILVWKEDDGIESAYSTELPATYGELIVFLQDRGINIGQIIDVYRNAGLHLRNGIPIIYAMKRPKKMVGYEGQYEFINFVVSAAKFEDNNYATDTEVSVQSHIEPFSKELATKVSGEERNLKTLFVGAGSLGSKIIAHEARGGNLNIAAADNDDLLQHNLIRHVLFSNKVGENKAKAVIKEVSDMFESDFQNGFKGYSTRVHRLSDATLKAYDRIVDTTASIDTLNWLALKELPEGIQVTRGEIADEGRLGLFYVEGKNRNPRMDDLVNLIYYNALDNDTLQQWRKRDVKREVNNLDVGLGCSSTTSIMSDDTISFHASAFSRVLSSQNSHGTKDEGLLYLSILGKDGIPDFRSEHQLVQPFDVYCCVQGSGWEVRMSSGIDERLLNLCKVKGNIETGGVLVGMANYKTKVIHVFDIIVEPNGSKGSYEGFIRGNKNLPAQIDEIKEKTGNVIGYIGEWHTHPMNLETLSDRDVKTINSLIKINRETPIPTCAIIVTKEKILPFIFE